MTRGLDLVFESDLPSAAGMSSSSALMVAVLLALARANRLDDHEPLARTRPRRDARTWRRMRRPSRTGARSAVWSEKLASAQRAAARITRRSSAAGRDSSVSSLSSPRATNAHSLPCRSDLCHRRERHRRAQNRRGPRRLQPRLAQRGRESWRGGGERTGRPDNSLAAAMRSSDDAPQRLRSWLADDRTLLDRFEQFLEESTQLVTAAGDQLAARDLDGFGRIVAIDRSSSQRNGFATRCRRPSRSRGWHAITAPLPRRRLAPGSAAASGRSSRRQMRRVFLDRWQNAYRGAPRPRRRGRDSF